MICNESTPPWISIISFIILIKSFKIRSSPSSFSPPLSSFLSPITNYFSDQSLYPRKPTKANKSIPSRNHKIPFPPSSKGKSKVWGKIEEHRHQHHQHSKNNSFFHLSFFVFVFVFVHQSSIFLKRLESFFKPYKETKQIIWDLFIPWPHSKKIKPNPVWIQEKKELVFSISRFSWKLWSHLILIISHQRLANSRWKNPNTIIDSDGIIRI